MICLNASIDLNFREEKVFSLCKTCVSKDVWKVEVKTNSYVMHLHWCVRYKYIVQMSKCIACLEYQVNLEINRPFIIS